MHGCWLLHATRNCEPAATCDTQLLASHDSQLIASTPLSSPLTLPYLFAGAPATAHPRCLYCAARTPDCKGAPELISTTPAAWPAAREWLPAPIFQPCFFPSGRLCKRPPEAAVLHAAAAGVAKVAIQLPLCPTNHPVPTIVLPLPLNAALSCMHVRNDPAQGMSIHLPACRSSSVNLTH